MDLWGLGILSREDAGLPRKVGSLGCRLQHIAIFEGGARGWGPLALKASGRFYGTVTLVPLKLNVPPGVPPPPKGLPFGGKKVSVMLPCT